MKTICRFLTVSLLVVAALTLSSARNKLFMVQTSSTTLEVHLQLDEDAAGVQFSASVSSGLHVQSFDLDGWFTNGSWITGSNLNNDSTVTVVLMSWSRQVSLPRGEWTIGSLSISENSSVGSRMSAWFSNALVADQHAKALDLTAESCTIGFPDARPTKAVMPESGLTLSAAYPNPFNPTTELAFTIAEAGDIRIAVVDILGRQIRILSDGFHVAGTGTVRWDGTDDFGATVASGMYLIAMTQGEHIQVQRVFLQK